MQTASARHIAASQPRQIVLDRVIVNASSSSRARLGELTLASVPCRRTEGWRRWYYVARAETWAPLTGNCIRPKQNVSAVQSIFAFLRQWQRRAASWLSPDLRLLRCTATLRYCRQCRPAINGGGSESSECGTSASCEWGTASERKACLGMSCPDQANWRTFSPEGARCEVTEAETTAWDIM